MARDRWIGAVEGYYGPPLSHGERLALVEWMGGAGFNCYGYAPKDDPYHRARWREPYPEPLQEAFRELVATGQRVGVDVAMVLSPGLDWRPGEDEAVLAEKLAGFAELGAPVVGVAWDDVSPGGADLGAAHGAGVAAAAAACAGLPVITCPTDYATSTATDYLRAYHAALPDHAEIMWTGPSIVSPHVTGAELAALGEAVGRPLLFAENFPVNDGAMTGVLHVGPAPARDPGLVAAARGVFCNFMSRPRASRVGLACAARFWLDPTSDREAVWEEVIAATPGIETLARACRAWAGDPGPDPQLVAWAEEAVAGNCAPLREYLFRDPRAGMDAALAAEVAPWADQWELESQAMQYACNLLDARPARPAFLAFAVAELWGRARFDRHQVFGVRWAGYPVTTGVGEALTIAPDALVTGPNLTDRLCLAALTGAPIGNS